MVDHIGSGNTGTYQNFSISFTLPGAGGGTVIWTSNPVDPGWTAPRYRLLSLRCFSYPNYNLYIDSYSINGCTAESSATITVNQPIIANAGPNQSKCNSGDFTLAGNSPATSTGVWSLVSGTANITTPASEVSGVTGVPAGTSVTLRWTIDNSPCSPTFDDVVLTNALPPTVTGITICQGGTGSVTAIASCPPGGSPVTSPTMFAGTGTSTGTGALWNNPTRIYANDDVRSTTNNIAANGGLSQSLNATNFGFAANIPPNSAILGVQVIIGRLGSVNTSIQDNSVQLIVNGTPTGINHALAGTWTTSEVAANYGAANDLWGVAGGITAAQVTSTNFGVTLE